MNAQQLHNASAMASRDRFYFTKWELFSAMANGQQITMPNGFTQSTTGRIMGISLEDGSGHCFNVVLQSLGDDMADNVYRTIFIRTID